MENEIEELYSFVQERYLWQFYSRAWDREQNIKGILNKTFEILTDKKSDTESPMDRYFYSEGVIFSEAIKEKFQWFLELDETKKKSILDGVQEKLLNIAINKSLNGELKNPAY